MGGLDELKTLEEFNQFISTNELVIVDFTATWCGPCQKIGPEFVELSKKYLNVKFVKVDVDVNGDTAEVCEVSAMPTFQLYKNGKKVGEVVGSSIQNVEELLKNNI
jgi:thioredoxin 1